jgi:DNA polymerase elongation subunit (family B)
LRYRANATDEAEQKNARSGTKIEFVVCRGGSDVSERARLPEDVRSGKESPDPEYYLKSQIQPLGELFRFAKVHSGVLREGKVIERSKVHYLMKIILGIEDG